MPYSFAPYSFSLLWSVFRLMPRISEARVLLLWVCSSVRRIRPFSASATVVPTAKEIPRQVRKRHGPFACHDHGALEHVAQLAHIARPVVFLEALQDVRREPRH